MDSSNTQQIPRSVVNEIDRSQDPDTTTVLPASMIAANDHHHLAEVEPTTRLDTGEPRRQAPQARQAPETEPINEPSEDSFSGLIPTVTQSSGRSNLSRRLDGI
jgi:hypothetical protein